MHFWRGANTAPAHGTGFVDLERLTTHAASINMDSPAPTQPPTAANTGEPMPSLTAVAANPYADMINRSSSSWAAQQAEQRRTVKRLKRQELWGRYLRPILGIAFCMGVLVLILFAVGPALERKMYASAINRLNAEGYTVLRSDGSVV